MTNPGSKGEHSLQKKFNTEKRAQAFYDNQVLDHLNPRMVEFVAKQEILFISTSDAKATVIVLLELEELASSMF